MRLRQKRVSYDSLTSDNHQSDQDLDQYASKNHKQTKDKISSLNMQRYWSSDEEIIEKSSSSSCNLTDEDSHPGKGQNVHQIIQSLVFADL